MHRTWTVAVATIAAVLAACGDTPPTRADWVKQADAACSTANAKIKALPRPQSLPDTATYSASAARLLHAEVAAVIAVPAAPADVAVVRQLHAALDQLVATADGLAQVAKGGNAAQIEAYVAGHRNASLAANAIARRLGLRVCGHGG